MDGFFVVHDENMNVYTVIYEQQRDKVYNDMQEALHKAKDTNERLSDILSLRYHSLRLVMFSTKKPPLVSRGLA